MQKDKDLYKQGAEAPENEATEGDAKAAKAAPKAKKISSKDMIFYRLTVTDNGCGMKHDEIPKMFGTVLSGTKYGVRQVGLLTGRRQLAFCAISFLKLKHGMQERGKFGLGSKMVLIWSKVSHSPIICHDSGMCGGCQVCGEGTEKLLSFVCFGIALNGVRCGADEHRASDGDSKLRGQHQACH